LVRPGHVDFPPGGATQPGSGRTAQTQAGYRPSVTPFLNGENKMIRTLTKQVFSMTLSILLVITITPFNAGAQQSAQQGANGYSGQGAPVSAEELQQLAAPIALYPDALVAQILGAATFPDQVASSAGWLQQNKNLTGNTLMKSVDAQPWEPSVKALTQFPSVLDNMAANLSWTSALGEAYATQPADVMSAVQVLRAKAQAAGNLKSGSQIKVVQESPQVIVVQPANPQVVYVPQYNPTVVYGTTYVVPGYTAPPVATAALAFGAGIAVGAMMSGGCCGWGYSYWNTNWHSSTVVYHSNTYYGNTAWHGGYYGAGGVSHYGAGYNPATGTYARGASTTTAYGTQRVGQAYNPNTGTYARGASTTTAYGTQKVGQAYNPNTGAYGATHQGSNAYGSYGSSVYSKNGQTAYTQHQTTSQGSVGSVQTSSGGKAVAGTGKYNSAAAGETASGNKYATANGNQYKNTGSGWQTNKSGSWNNVQKPSSSGSSAASRGWGGQEKSSGSSAFSGGGGGGWESRSASARGSASMGGGGGGGGGRGRR
jgi:hypothetical protein